MRPRGNTFIQEIQLYDKYARWRADEQRRETWPEVVERVLTFFQSQPKAATLTPDVWAQVRTAFLAQDILPSMRVVQMAGPALDRCHVGAYNCAYTTLTGPQDVAEVLYILMQGTGVGYSVERRYTDQWPEVSDAPEESISTYVVPDTTEGWCEAFRRAMEGALAHQVWTFDLSQIRPEGAWLHTKGGRASGPAPLRHLLAPESRLQFLQACPRGLQLRSRGAAAGLQSIAIEPRQSVAPRNMVPFLHTDGVDSAGGQESQRSFRCLDRSRGDDRRLAGH